MKKKESNPPGKNTNQNSSSRKKVSGELIFGIWPMIEAIRAGKEFEKVYIQYGLQGEHVPELIQLLKEHDIPFQRVHPDQLNRLTRKNHQGVVAFTSLIQYQPLEEIIQMAFEKGRNPLLLLLDQITDVRNFGAIARTAEVAGIDGIIIPRKNSARINADAMKTSAGALNHVAVSKVRNLSQTIDFLKESGLQIVAATEQANDFYTSVDYTLPTVILIGGEEKGIEPILLKKADRIAKIPMFGKTGSLNASVAAAIFLYEAIRQRMHNFESEG